MPALLQWALRGITMIRAMSKSIIPMTMAESELSSARHENATNDGFGHFVDITANGMTIICGSPWTGTGYVRVFSLVDGNNNLGTATWEEIG
jgi:hypothetical protein